MSTPENETGTAPLPAPFSTKPLLILIGVTLFLSLGSLIISLMLLMRPVSSLIEQGNSEIKESLDSKSASLGKRIDGLRDACIDWQAVLKTASEKPEATFRIIKGEDGLLTLTEVK